MEPDPPAWTPGPALTCAGQADRGGRAASECWAGLCRQCPRGQLGPGLLPSAARAGESPPGLRPSPAPTPPACFLGVKWGDGNTDRVIGNIHQVRMCAVPGQNQFP